MSSTERFIDHGFYALKSKELLYNFHAGTPAAPGGVYFVARFASFAGPGVSA